MVFFLTLSPLNENSPSLSFGFLLLIMIKLTTQNTFFVLLSLLLQSVFSCFFLLPAAASICCQLTNFVFISDWLQEWEKVEWKRQIDQARSKWGIKNNGFYVHNLFQKEGKLLIRIITLHILFTYLFLLYSPIILY